MVTLPFTAKRKNKPSPDNMTLGEHLGELRRRVIICVVAFSWPPSSAVFLYEPILDFLLRPLCNVGGDVGSAPLATLVKSGSTCNLFVTLAARRAVPAGQDRASSADWSWRRR